MPDPIIKHVVHLRGLLRQEGPLDDSAGFEYRWRNGQLVFYMKVNPGDIVNVDTFVDGVLCERSQFVALDSPANQPFRWDRRITQKFCE